MSLVTRCTSCATTFRVLPAQLAAREGRVRCGKCSAVFNGVANLLTEEAVEALAAEPSPQLGLFEARETAAKSDAGGPMAASADPGTAIASAHIAAPAVETPVPKSTEAKPGAPQPAPRRPAAAKDAGQAPVPAFLSRERPRTTYALVWGLLSLIALAALAAQVALHFRTEIAVLAPQARMHLETACEILGCQVRLPRRADLLSIESSDLQTDAARPGVIVLNALLRNRAPFEQEYPDLELTLTDARDEPVIRRVLKPGDYLQEKRSAIAQGIAAGAEEAVRIHFDTGRIPATGYRLYLFYP